MSLKERDSPALVLFAFDLSLLTLDPLGVPLHGGALHLQVDVAR